MYSDTAPQNTAKEHLDVQSWLSQKSENTKSHNAILNFYKQITPFNTVRSLSANCPRNRFFSLFVRSYAILKRSFDAPTSQSRSCSDFHVIIATGMDKQAMASFPIAAMFTVSARGLLPATDFHFICALLQHEFFGGMSILGIGVTIQLGEVQKLLHPSISSNQIDLPFLSRPHYAFFTYFFEHD